MTEYVRQFIVICAVSAAAVALAPSDRGTDRGVKLLASILVAAAAAAPIASVGSAISAFFDRNEAAIEVEPPDASTYGEAVLGKTAEIISDYVKKTLSSKFGIECVRVSVLFDDETETVSLSEVQIFTGTRIDSYRDREIEDQLGGVLGCEVYIFSG
ncbi:MAG: hypothetical protein IJS78_04815 [Clostridia bacterium]|nr:hypothetical protein [Clostridia bacterium]